MNTRSVVILVLAVIGAIALLSWLTSCAATAPATRRHVEHGTFKRLPDGGMHVTECYRVLDGGSPEGPVRCEHVERSEP